MGVAMNCYVVERRFEGKVIKSCPMGKRLLEAHKTRLFSPPIVQPNTRNYTNEATWLIALFILIWYNICNILIECTLGGENVAIQITIDEDKIDNFSNDAQTTLKKQIDKYTDDIIKEANLIEEGIRENGASTEITSNIVLQAVRKNKTYHNKKKSNKILLITKVVSALSLLITGFLFDSSGYENNKLGLIAFVVFLIIASVSTVLQFVFEDKEWGYEYYTK